MGKKIQLCVQLHHSSHCVTKPTLQITVFCPVSLYIGTVSRTGHLNIAHKFSAEEIKSQHYCLQGGHVISPLEYGICNHQGYKLNFAEELLMSKYSQWEQTEQRPTVS